MAFESAYKRPDITASPTPTPATFHRSRRGSPIVPWVIGILSFLVIAVFIASFFLDSFVRARVEARMNEKLIGYHTRLPRAHVQLLDLSLTLWGLTIVQDAHPSPPVADISKLAFRIQWGELILGHVVADVQLTHPNLHINLTQLKSEHADKVPLSHKGPQTRCRRRTDSRSTVFEFATAK